MMSPEVKRSGHRYQISWQNGSYLWRGMDGLTPGKDRLKRSDEGEKHIVRILIFNIYQLVKFSLKIHGDYSFSTELNIMVYQMLF